MIFFQDCIQTQYKNNKEKQEILLMIATKLKQKINQIKLLEQIKNSKSFIQMEFAINNNSSILLITRRINSEQMIYKLKVKEKGFTYTPVLNEKTQELVKNRKYKNMPI